MKAEANLRKHGVTFDFATNVFFDPNRIEYPEREEHEGEERWLAVGLTEELVLVGVFNLRKDAIRIISARRAVVMNTSDTGLVRFKYDPKNPPTMTPEQLQALRELREEEIDYSDIPSQGSAGWRRVSELVPEENKQQITLRLDAEVLAFFKSTGRRYQSRINAALREYMNSHRNTRSARIHIKSETPGTPIAALCVFACEDSRRP